MSYHVYNVKQAAKILGLSTNTTYKYLNEGRIKASRGHLRGTFIITHKALENFLGSPLPDNPLESGNYDINPSSFDPEAVIEVVPPSFTTKTARIILTICLLLIIADLIMSTNISVLSQSLRLSALAILILLSYQFGGFTKK